ncbi:hypothetical protein J2W56_002546 [Nocardia kruczakiae]|uniref:Quercetin 2,3-dioxygenase C-terminal cupin domain-containing protein n=1 Tax=Nocardia kruczakiae TaxID=261477 RepID=A0ABU1XE47_9NOCA|nr:hypothetical protein [Nocardia kruczakiae]MDR7168815.1 hypothetical protein [Nocardia kruczakiae]
MCPPGNPRQPLRGLPCRTAGSGPFGPGTEAPFGHIFLARGSAVFEGTPDGQATLSAGDAVRTTATGEVLIWEMHASTS